MDSISETTWQDLAAKAQKGDTTAYRDLLTAIVPVIRRNISGKIPNRDNIDDVVQDVLLSVHKALHTYNPDRPFTPWLLSIINFRRADALRAHYAQKQNMQLSLDAPDVPDYLHSQGFMSTRADGTMKDIETAFSGLPDQQKKVVELMKIKGYSAEEVSQKTGMSVSAVKVSAHRALARLRERI